MVVVVCCCCCSYHWHYIPVGGGVRGGDVLVLMTGGLVLLDHPLHVDQGLMLLRGVVLDGGLVLSGGTVSGVLMGVESVGKSVITFAED